MYVVRTAMHGLSERDNKWCEEGELLADDRFDLKVQSCWLMNE